VAVALKAPARVLLALVGLSLLGYAAWEQGWIGGRPKGGSPAAPDATSAPPKGAKVTLDFLYTTEKERWLKGALEEFAKARPDIYVKARGVGTIESIRLITEGKEAPVAWSPADEVAINLLDTEWSLQKGAPIVDRAEDVAPQPLVITPLVVIAWEERAKALAKAGTGDPADWAVIHQLATNPKGWLGVGASAEWGFVKLGHTAPNTSNSGLQALILMAYGFHGKAAGLTQADILDEKFQKWLKEIETAVGKFGNSSGTYMRDMVLFGPSKYDLIWNYESVAISEMAAAQGRWGNLSVYYPKPTLWSNHPFVVLKSASATVDQREAAKVLRDFLLSAPIQQRALDAGFRPANPEVKVLTADPNNPWNRLKPYGVRVDIPPTAEPPSGEVTRLLLETWRRVMGVPAA
jgi:ABC-type Fe3+ transport system substrate-binding protein